MKLPKRNEHGFTLIELLVTIVIIGIISSVIILAAAAAQRQARDSQRQGDLKNIQTALQQYYTDQGFFPDASFDLSSKITNCTTIASCTPTRTYLDSIPKDPSASNTYCYNAYTNSTKSTSCDNTSATSASHCNYYSLYAKLEGGPASTLTCGGKSYNFEINPS